MTLRSVRPSLVVPKSAAKKDEEQKEQQLMTYNLTKTNNPLSMISLRNC